MAMVPGGKSLYVVNYGSNTMSKVRTSDMNVIQVVNTIAAPIGITYDAPTKSVWALCYSGSVMVFGDR
jgi:YVTN family beta-propeller protein